MCVPFSQQIVITTAMIVTHAFWGCIDLKPMNMYVNATHCTYYDAVCNQKLLMVGQGANFHSQGSATVASTLNVSVSCS